MFLVKSPSLMVFTQPSKPTPWHRPGHRRMRPVLHLVRHQQPRLAAQLATDHFLEDVATHVGIQGAKHVVHQNHLGWGLLVNGLVGKSTRNQGFSNEI